MKFAEGELVEARAAAAAAGLKFNAWVRRACREQAALERALVVQELEGRTGLEREGWDPPVMAARRLSTDEVRQFRPDFK